MQVFRLVVGKLVGLGLEVAAGVDCTIDDEGAASVGSLQPNQPGVSQVLVSVLVGREDVVVMVGAGAALGVVAMVEDDAVVVVGSLQPNQPGVLHVDVEVEDVLVDVDPDVVVSSRQPHQPGVLHVSVLVRVEVVELLVLVMGSLPLLSKNFQLKQSWHSISSSQIGTVSYFSSTSLITLTIL